jgi:hypothetical protein
MRDWWASHISTIGPTDPVSVKSINIGLAHDPQTDKVGPSLHAFIETRASCLQRLRCSLNRPANKEHVFPLPKGYEQRRQPPVRSSWTPI